VLSGGDFSDQSEMTTGQGFANIAIPSAILGFAFGTTEKASTYHYRASANNKYKKAQQGLEQFRQSDQEFVEAVEGMLSNMTPETLSTGDFPKGDEGDGR
jgi:hypothetical protein